ncbi:MAG TPA: tetratricopeptide repeat protein [Bauldia sp.]|nr:tetratricopeptide repeat protein [Bauldia sp.]
MSDIFREVDEDLRREQYKKLWDRFGSYVIGLAILIVVATAGYRGWEYWQNQKAETSGDAFVAALRLADEGKHPEALAALDALVADGNGGYPALAAFRAAGEKQAAGDATGAVAAYEAIAARRDAPILVGDLARLRAAMILADTASLEELDKRIGDLASTGNPWRHSARELLGLAAWRVGDATTSRKYFDEIMADQEAPQSVRSRAQFMLGLITAEEGAPAAAPAPAPAG